MIPFRFWRWCNKRMKNIHRSNKNLPHLLLNNLDQFLQRFLGKHPHKWIEVGFESDIYQAAIFFWANGTGKEITKGSLAIRNNFQESGRCLLVEFHGHPDLSIDRKGVV